MILDLKHLIGLPVETKSGSHVGKVHDVRVEAETQTVLQYEVRRSGLIKELLATELLVHRDQVIVITEKKMVVDDLVIPEGEAERGVARLPASSPTT